MPGKSAQMNWPVRKPSGQPPVQITGIQRTDVDTVHVAHILTPNTTEVDYDADGWCLRTWFLKMNRNTHRLHFNYQSSLSFRQAKLWKWGLYWHPKNYVRLIPQIIQSSPGFRIRIWGGFRGKGSMAARKPTTWRSPSFEQDAWMPDEICDQ